MTAPESDNPQRPGAMAWIGCAFAVAVLAIYVTTDGIPQARYGRVGATVWLALAMAVGAGALGAAVTRPGRTRVVAAAVAATVFGSLLLGGERWWGRLFAQSDELRMLAMLVSGAAIGLAVHLGAARTATTRRGLWIALTVLPFAVVNTLAGAWTATAGLVWLFALAGGLGGILGRALRIHPGEVCRKFAAHGAGPTRRSRGCRSSTCPPAGDSVAVAMGTLVLCQGTLILGLAGACNQPALLIAMVAATVLTARSTGRCGVALLGSVAVRTPATAGIAAIHGATVALLTAYWIAALGPETGPDAIAFRTAAPLRWFHDGAIVADDGMIASFGTFASECLYLLAMPTCTTSAARAVSFAVLLLLLRGLHREVLPRSERATIWLFPWVASTMFWWQMAAGFVDLTQLWLAIGAVLAFQAWRADPRIGWLAAAGWCAGGAAAIKLNGAFTLLTIAALWTMRRPQAVRGPGVLLGHAGAMGLAFALAVLPWFWRSWILTGNPLFPFANGVFGSPLGEVEPAAALFSIGTAPVDLLRLPWAIWFEPRSFAEAGTFHPAILALLPLGALGVVRHGGPGRPWLAIGAIAFGFWAITLQNTRYAMFPITGLAVGTALGLAAWESRLDRRGAAWLAGVALLACGLGTATQHVRAGSGPWNQNSEAGLPSRTVLGDQTASEYLTDRVASFGAAQWLNREVGREAWVWQVPPGLADHQYFEARTTAHPHAIRPRLAPLAPLLVDPDRRRDLHGIWSTLRDLGYTHVLYSVATHHFDAEPDSERAGVYRREFWQRYLDPCHAHRGARLFSIRETPRRSADLDRAYGPALRAIDGSSKIAVAGETLYSISAEVTGAGGFDLTWRDADAETLLVHSRHWPSETVAGVFEVLQTAPAGTATLEVVFRGCKGQVRRLTTP